MPRIYFDVTLEDGEFQRDGTGVSVGDVGTALLELVQALLDLPQEGVARVTARHEAGSILLDVNISAIRASVHGQTE